jgi:hypothetical protein
MIDSIPHDVLATVGDRTSLFEGCWKQQCSAFEYVHHHRSRTRDYEVETLAKLDEAARSLEAKAGLEAPSPPKPGVADKEVL